MFNPSQLFSPLPVSSLLPSSLLSKLCSYLPSSSPFLNSSQLSSASQPLASLLASSPLFSCLFSSLFSILLSARYSMPSLRCSALRPCARLLHATPVLGPTLLLYALLYTPLLLALLFYLSKDVSQRKCTLYGHSH